MNSQGPANTSGIARVMIVLTWVLLLGIMTYFFNGLVQQRLNPNANPQGVITENGGQEVTLLRNAMGHYVAGGYINGFPVTFLLDTGATDVAIPESLADKLGLQRQAGGFSQTANGVVAVWQTELAEVRVGAVSRTGVRASILPSMGAGEEVLLGMSFLKYLELVQKGNELTLRQ